MVRRRSPPLTVVDRHRLPSMPPLTSAVDRWSGDDAGTVITPRGTTQVVTRGILMIGVRGTVQVYEVVSMRNDPEAHVASKDCHVTIPNTLDNLGKFDGKSDEGFFVGYSLSRKAFRVYNIRTMRVEENLHIGFLENKPMTRREWSKWLFDIDSLTKSMNFCSCCCSPKEVNVVGQHVNTASPKDNTGRFKLNTVDPSVNTASSYEKIALKTWFQTTCKLLKLYMIILGRSLCKRILQFKLQQVWKLVELPNGKRAIGQNGQEEGFYGIANGLKSALFLEQLRKRFMLLQQQDLKIPDTFRKVYKVVQGHFMGCIRLQGMFWGTTTARTTDDGEVEITASIDGQVKTIIEAYLRRHLKLEDSDGITSLPNTEIFEQLALMGPKTTAWEQFSSNIATAIIFLATNRTSNFSKMIFDAMVKNLDSTHKFLMYLRFLQICLNKQKRLLQPHTKTYPTPTFTQKLYSNMKRVSKGYSGVDFPLFPIMITTPESSPSIITSSPFLSPQTHQSSPLRDITRQAAEIPQS
ncbi:putative ribonuclease H-like domain-containing protein [Tanacetum coccineum]